MAYGKNKGLAKGGKKGTKKKQMDPFLKKVWYDIKAPSYFGASKRSVGKTVVTKTQGLKSETESLKGRVAEFNVADIRDHSQEEGHKKVKLEIQDIQGKSCLTDFHAMNLTRDKMNFLIKKKHSLIDVAVDCKTQDGYVARVFVIAFTKEARDKQNQLVQNKIFTFAQSAQIKHIRAKITQTLQQEIGAGPMKQMVSALMLDTMESKIKSCTNRIFPLDPVHIYKVKLVKKPKMDTSKLWEIHDKDDDMGVQAEQIAEAPEAKNTVA